MHLKHKNLALAKTNNLVTFYNTHPGNAGLFLQPQSPQYNREAPMSD